MYQFYFICFLFVFFFVLLFYKKMIQKNVFKNIINNMKNMNSNIIISIEGNIGSGKSTILSCIQNMYQGYDDKQIIFLKEPVDEWENITDETGSTILKLFYETPEKYAFSFQMMAYISRLNNLKQAIKQNKNAIIITERSLFTDRYVFAKMLYDDKKIRHVDYSIYMKWFDAFIEDFPVDKVIYVNSSPTICCQRIKKRSRNGESIISLEYLQNCHKYHNDMMTYYTRVMDIDNIYIFNGDIEENEREEHIQNMLKFIKN